MELPVHKVHRGKQVLKEQLVRRVHKERLAHKVLRAQRELMELTE